jgi:hypothetical protein
VLPKGHSSFLPRQSYPHFLNTVNAVVSYACLEFVTLLLYVGGFLNVIPPSPFNNEHYREHDSVEEDH